jgi:ribosomal protein L44E
VPTEEERITEREARKRVKDERRGKRAARGVGADGTPVIKTEDEVSEGGSG